VITSVDPDELLKMEEEAAGSRFRPLNSLTRYWRVDVRGLVEPLENLVKRFAQVSGVETAYAEMVVSDPVVNAADDPFNAQQGYENAAPQGIDARWAWTQTGGEGQGVGVVDLEQGWRLGHEDLASKAPTLIFNVNRDGVGTYVGNHGTAVLGEIAADDNTRGVVGIAPSLASLRVTSYFDGVTAVHVADAAIAALPTMNAGDVLLMEVQRGSALLPAEPRAPGLPRLRGGHGRRGIVWDRRRVTYALELVELRQPDRLLRLGDERHDCRLRRPHAGSADRPVLHGCVQRDEQRRTDRRGRRGADAEHVPRRHRHASLARPDARDCLPLRPCDRHSAKRRRRQKHRRDAERATNRRGGPGSGPGRVPARCGWRQWCDPERRRAQHEPGRHRRATPVVNPTAAFGEGSGTENDETLGFRVEAGQDNTIYVRIRNRGATAATGVTATVYWSDVSTLVTPNMWNVIGTTAPVDVPTGNTLIVAPALTWPAADVPPTGHYCFVAVLDHPQDPAPPIPGPTDRNGFLDIVRNNNNVTWRNFDVVDVLADPQSESVELPFLLAGAPGQDRLFDFEIAVHLPADARLFLSLPPAAVAGLPAHWRERVRPGGNEDMVLAIPRLRRNAICGVRLHADALHKCRFVVRPSKGMAAGLSTVEIRQFDGDLQVGGVKWGLRPKR
jgi:hypothetical protein